MKRFPVQLELMRKRVWIEREFFPFFFFLKIGKQTAGSET